MKIVQSLIVLSLSTLASAKLDGEKGRRTQLDGPAVSDYAGKKGFGYAGKKGCSDYAGKKGYGIADGYAGKKGYDYGECEEPDIDQCFTGKKGSYYSGKKGHHGKGGAQKAGKKGGTIVPIPDTGDSCVICDKQNKNKPTSLVLQYNSDGANSAFQPSGKASCREGDYPSPARIEVNGMAYDVVDGDLIEIYPDGANTDFKIVPIGASVFEEDIECFIHTSCSVPIVVGDQIGPFIVEGDEECEAPEPDCCPHCAICDTGRPELLKLKYHSAGEDSAYQPPSKASCTAGLYPASTSVTVEGSTYDLMDGDTFTVTPQFNGFSAETDFYFEDPFFDCHIHTSCSVPLMLGDIIGPFEVIGDEDCEKTDTCDPTCEECGGKCIETTVGVDPITGETTLTVDLDYTNLDLSRKWDPNTCDKRDPYFDQCGSHINPEPSDWIGFYPCEEKQVDSSGKSFVKEPRTWAYTCYDRDCRTAAEPTTEGSIVFQDSTLWSGGREGIYDSILELEQDGGGCYVVMLNKLDGFSPPPYYNICEGNEIMLPDKSGASDVML